jgi:hypothetical protein
MLTGLVNGQASKFLVAVLSAVASGLAVFYGNARWEPVAVMAVGAVMTWLIPNAPAPGQAAAPQVRNL